ncbi:hypothetical protein [Shimia biformata]|uniref:hypothetical protein n=1 Tax=Shimia biformata TaxID=1294299 RepID=UPI00194E4167|nr:hypothetical protein [Shimia biformata]
MSAQDETYPGGFNALWDRYNSRREGFEFYRESLPDLDTPLEPLTRRIVPEAATARREGEPKKMASWTRKRREIAKEFVGNSELAYLNAMLIANLRRETFPVDAPALFVRLWAEQSPHLIEALDLRWKVSSIMTFADHGATDIQRQVGQALRMLFGLMKLYEWERMRSGKTADQQWPYDTRQTAPLPLEMEQYSLKSGGLDVNLLAPVWQLAKQDVIIAPLTDHLLDSLNREPGGLFRRLKLMREDRARDKGEA